MLLLAAEATPLEIAKGRYSGQANFDVFLKAYSGDPLRVQRVGRPDTLIPTPSLAMALLVQPDVIAGLTAHTGMRGRGFLARLLYAVPVPLLGRRQVAPPRVPLAVHEGYEAGVRALWRLGAELRRQRLGQHAYLLSLDAEAEAALRAFEVWLEPQLAPGGAAEALEGWGGKLAGTVVRLAGLLHALDALGKAADLDNLVGLRDAVLGQPVSADCVVRAARLARDYLLPHAQVAFRILAADPVRDRARRLLRSLTQTPATRLTRRDAFRRLHWLCARVSDVDAVLALLVEHGYLATLAEEGFAVHPELAVARG
jgi:hypothetical protein